MEANSDDDLKDNDDDAIDCGGEIYRTSSKDGISMKELLLQYYMCHVYGWR